MTPRVQELLDRLKTARAERLTGMSLPTESAETKVRERIIVEKYDHERGETPVLIETVECIVVNGVPAEHIVTKHQPTESPPEGN